MSRGLGRLERFILDQLNETLDGKKVPASLQASSMAADHFRPEDWYATHHQPGDVFEPTQAQRKAMIRAFHSFVSKHPQYALAGGTGRKTLLLYEPGDPVSAAWARLMRNKSFVSYSEARAAAARDAQAS